MKRSPVPVPAPVPFPRSRSRSRFPTYRTPGGTVYRLYTDLAARPHLLLAGATGSGKSVSLNGIIYNISAAKSPYEANFVLIDPKKVELIQWEGLPHVLRYASETPDIVRALQWAVEETEARFRGMQAARSRMYEGPDLYIIIAELADLMTTIKKEALPPLQRLAQIGRAARVHVIACSQNILAQTIPTILKCNFPAVLGLRTATAQQSRFLISVPGCETLPDPRREGTAYGFLRDGADLMKVRLHMYSDADISRIVSYWTSAECIVS